MKKKISVLIGTVLSLQTGLFFAPAADAAGGTPPAKMFTVTPEVLTLTEGETATLTVTAAPEYADGAIVKLYGTGHKTIVSADGTVTAYHSGDDNISVYVSCPDSSSETGFRVETQYVPVHVQQNEALPAESRAEIDRLQAASEYGDYQRRTLELLGIPNMPAARITAEQISAILLESASSEEIVPKIEEIHGYPDYIRYGDPTHREYWFDDKGSEKLEISNGDILMCHSVCADGTVKDVSLLYPPEFPFQPVNGLTDGSDRTYLVYNQLPYDDFNPVSGDINRDGVFNFADAVTLKKYLMSLPAQIPLPERADFNADGQVNAVDYVLLKRALLER